MEKAAETLKDVLELQGALDLDPSTREMCLETLVELPGWLGGVLGLIWFLLENLQELEKVKITHTKR